MGGCLRFRDLSFARRALRSVAAASRDAWEAIEFPHSERWRVEWVLLSWVDGARVRVER